MALTPSDIATMDQAADELRRFGIRMEAIQKLPAVLERIGSVARAEQDALARIEALRKDEEAAKGKVKKAQDAVTDAGTKAASIIAAANAEAGAIADTAKADAKKVADAAKDKAAQAIAVAQRKVDALEVEAKVKASDLLLLADKMTAANSELDRINGVIAEARARLGG